MKERLEIKVDDTNFEKEVLESETPVLVDFWAEWCFPCRMIAPMIGEIADEYKDRLKVCKINVEEASWVSSNYEIMNVPTFMIFKNGQVVDKAAGAVSKNVLVSKINAQI